MKVLFLYNPQSGQQRLRTQMWSILNCFCEAGYDLTVQAISKGVDASEIVQNRIDEFELFICSGGDGTLNRVDNGMMLVAEEKRKVIAYIPSGSTNDFSVSLKIPRNMTKAAENIVNNDVKKYDVGKFNDSYFVYVAAFGAFTEVSFATDQQLKNMLGHLAYIVEGVRSLSTIKSYKLKIRTDEENYDGEYIFGMITNSVSVGGVYRLDNQDVKLDDGLFEVTLIKKPISLFEAQKLQQDIFSSPLIINFKTDHIRIEAEDRIPWALDGEDGNSPKKAEIQVVRCGFCLKH